MSAGPGGANAPSVVEPGATAGHNSARVLPLRPKQLLNPVLPPFARAADQLPELPRLVSCAQLPLLPSPLRLKHGPLLVTLKWWGDGSVVADLPCCALYGEGETDTAAIEDLADTILDWASGTAKLGRENLGGALLRQWDSLISLVDVSGL